MGTAGEQALSAGDTSSRWLVGRVATCSTSGDLIMQDQEIYTKKRALIKSWLLCMNLGMFCHVFVSNTSHSSPGKWSQQPAWKSLRNIWKMFSGMCDSWGWCATGPGIELNGPGGSLPDHSLFCDFAISLSHPKL